MRQLGETMQMRRMRQHRVVGPQICRMRQRRTQKGLTVQIRRMRQCGRVDTQIRRLRQRGPGLVENWMVDEKGRMGA